jgi:hypothetical protein
MKIQTPLDLYDVYVVSELQKKHTAITNANWLYAPASTDVGFRYAETVFGKNKFFPIYFVFRHEPANKTEDITAPAKFNVKFLVGDNKRNINVINTKLSYQIDFYSNNMYDINNFNMDYFRFQRERFLEFDFSEVSLNFKNKFEVQFEEVEANHTIEEQFTVGRYFRYTYKINLIVPLFDITPGIEIDRVILGVYQTNTDPQNQLFSQTTIVTP